MFAPARNRAAREDGRGVRSRQMAADRRVPDIPWLSMPTVFSGGASVVGVVGPAGGDPPDEPGRIRAR
jgi:hypothetical protein